MYDACKIRSIKLMQGTSYSLLRFNNAQVGYIDCFNYKEKTFANCEARTAFTDYRALTYDHGANNFGSQHYFRD